MKNFPFSKRETIIIAATLILIVSIPFGVFLVKKQQILKSRAEERSCQSDKTNLPIERYCLEKTLIKVFSFTENNQCKLFYEPSTDSCDILKAKYTISGFVFIDTNKNESKDADESGVPNRIVLLTDRNRTVTHKSVQTNNEGKYEFVDIKGGEYRVTHEVPQGFQRTSDDSVVSAVRENYTQHFGLIQTIFPSPSASVSPAPTASSTSFPAPSPSVTPVPTSASMPVPTPVITPTPVPLQTSEPTPVSTPEPTPTELPHPTPTPTPTPIQSATKQFDLNDDGWVNSFDVGIFLNAWKVNNTRADFNGDRRVNSMDYGMLKNWMGKRVF